MQLLRLLTVNVCMLLPLHYRQDQSTKRESQTEGWMYFLQAVW